MTQHDVPFRASDGPDDSSHRLDFLARVDLGNTTVYDAETRASETVGTILEIAVHRSGGVRPHLAQFAVFIDGRLERAGSVMSSRNTGFDDDHYGQAATAEAVGEHGPGIAKALARRRLPRFLAAVLGRDVADVIQHPTGER